jgi:hypothetical protein
MDRKVKQLGMLLFNASSDRGIPLFWRGNEGEVSQRQIVARWSQKILVEVALIVDLRERSKSGGAV